MKKIVSLLTMVGILMVATLASAAPGWSLVQDLDVTADNAVTPIDHSFFDQGAPGKVILSDVKNLWGAGAKMIFYVEGDSGSDWLVLGFGGGMVEIKLQNRKLPLLSEKVSAITTSTPLVMTVEDGQLTVSIGRKSRTVKGVATFTGSLTTQSISCRLKSYQLTEQEQ